MEKEILLKVELDKSQLQVELEETTKQLLENKESVSELNSAFKEGKVSIDEYVKSSLKLKSEQKTLTEQQKQLTKEVESESNSINGLRAKLSALTKERNAINQGTKEGAARFKELQKEIFETTEKLKEQEQAGGDFRRNVGNYKQAFKDAAGGIQVFGMSLKDMYKLILTNPFVLAIAGAAGLFQILKGFEEVFDFFERGLAAIKAGFDALFGGNFSDIAEAADEAYNLAGALQELEDNQRGFTVESAKAEAQIKNLIIQSKDRTKTEQERLALLDQAGKIEEANFRKGLEFAKEEERIAKAKLARAEQNGRANDELRDKAAEAEVKRIQLESSSADLQEKLANRRNALLEAEQAEKDKALEKEKERLKKIEDANKKVAEERAKIRERERQAEQKLFELRVEQQIKEAATIEEKLKKQLELENKRREFLLANTKLTQSERQLIIEQSEANILSLYQKTAEEQVKIEERRLEAEAKITEFVLEQNLEKAKSIEEKVQHEIELETFRKDQLLLNDQLLAEERALIEEQFNAKVIKINEDAEQKKRLEAEKTAKLQADIERQRVNLAGDVAETLAGLAKDGSEAQKFLASSAALINTYQGVTGALANSAPPPVGLGPAGALISAGLIFAQGIANVAKINAAAGGGDFVTTKPTLLLVGDNPGGRERVTVEPLSGKGKTKVFKDSGLIAMAGGGSITTGAAISRRLSGPIDNEFTQVNNLASVISNLPPQEVSVKEVTRVRNRVQVKESIKNL
jgi:hypothetical protein